MCVCVCVGVGSSRSSEQPDRKVRDVRHRIPRIVSVVLGSHPASHLPISVFFFFFLILSNAESSSVRSIDQNQIFFHPCLLFFVVLQVEYVLGALPYLIVASH